MATVPFTPRKPPPAEPDPNDPILKAMNVLVQRARTDRARHQGRISDCYRYTMPWRHKTGQNQPSDDLDEVFDETPGITLEDFSADMLNTFTPQKNNWLSEAPTQKFENKGAQAGFMKQIGEMLKNRQRVIFDEMARSNLYQALQEAYKDLGPGTMCILIPPDQNPAEPIRCEAIPATDLLLTRGPDGLVDGKFRERKYLRSELEYLWPDAQWHKLGEWKAPLTSVDPEHETIDGCWRDWKERGTETYNYAVQCQGKIIYHKKYTGAGSCPFIVARWSRDSTTAWGFGPTYLVLPAIKTLNHVRFVDLKNYDKHVDPPTSYEDDGVINVDQGVNPGDWIPRAVGSKAPEPIESKAKFDVAVFERDELRSVIRRAHYQDRPEQLGKTPPTAFQWADERAERARRMGTPATNLVVEEQIPLYKRFSYILAQRGTLPKVVLNGQDVGLQPISPLLRAQEQEEVIRLDRFAEMLTVRFGPQIAIVVINVVKYAHRLAELLGIDSGLLRDEADIANAIQQLMPVLQNLSGGGGGEIAPPPVGAIGP